MVAAAKQTSNSEDCQQQQQHRSQARQWLEQRWHQPAAPGWQQQ
jgi:hypothetical protein